MSYKTSANLLRVADHRKWALNVAPNYYNKLNILLQLEIYIKGFIENSYSYIVSYKSALIGSKLSIYVYYYKYNIKHILIDKIFKKKLSLGLHIIFNRTCDVFIQNIINHLSK